MRHQCDTNAPSTTPPRPNQPAPNSYGNELAAAAHEGAAVARDVFAAAASWTRLLGRAFITRSAQRGAKALVEAKVPGLVVEGFDEDE